MEYLLHDLMRLPLADRLSIIEQAISAMGLPAQGEQLHQLHQLLQELSDGIQAASVQSSPGNGLNC